MARQARNQQHHRIQSLLNIIEDRDARIRVLEAEIRALRGVVATMNLDPRFWIGLPIGACDERKGVAREDPPKR
jgi:hypothetical protein